MTDLMPTSEPDRDTQCKPPVRGAPPAIVAEVVRDDTDASAQDAASSSAGPFYTASASFHWTILTLCVAIIAASTVLTVREGEHVTVPIINVTLPGTCTFRRLTGHPCPGCGLTRSFISMGHGQLGAAWQYNPAGWLFFAVVLFQIPYRLLQLRRIRLGQPEHRFVRFDRWILVVLVSILLLHWVFALTASFS